MCTLLRNGLACIHGHSTLMGSLPYHWEPRCLHDKTQNVHLFLKLVCVGTGEPQWVCLGLSEPSGAFQVDKLLSKTSPSCCYSSGDNFKDHHAYVVQLESNTERGFAPKELLVPKLKGTVLIQAEPTMTSLSGIGQGNSVTLVLVEHISCSGQGSESGKVLNVLPR